MVEFVEVGDQKPDHRPETAHIPIPSTLAEYSYRPAEDMPRQFLGYLAFGLADVQDIMVSQVHSDFTLLATDADDHSLQLGDFGERTVIRLLILSRARKLQQPRAGPLGTVLLSLTQIAGRTVINQQFIQSLVRLPRILWSALFAHRLDAFAHRRLCLLLDLLEQDCASFLDADKMHLRLLAEQRGHLGHVLR